MASERCVALHLVAFKLFVFMQQFHASVCSIVFLLDNSQFHLFHHVVLLSQQKMHVTNYNKVSYFCMKWHLVHTHLCNCTPYVTCSSVCMFFVHHSYLSYYYLKLNSLSSNTTQTFAKFCTKK